MGMERIGYRDPPSLLATADVLDVPREAGPRLAVHLSSQTPEHYTPASFLAFVLDIFDGEIDVDPCGHSHETPRSKHSYVGSASKGSWRHGRLPIRGGPADGCLDQDDLIPRGTRS
jgi:hypothetical protein